MPQCLSQCFSWAPFVDVRCARWRHERCPARCLLIFRFVEFVWLRSGCVVAVSRRVPSGRTPDTPFFLYLPFQNVHDPYDCSSSSYMLFRHLNMTAQERVLFGYIYEMDQAVGRVMSALHRNNLVEDTVVVFISDNGAPRRTFNVPGSTRNWPLRGAKNSLWEGGTRVPAFVYAPGRITAGTVVVRYAATRALGREWCGVVLCCAVWCVV